MKPKQFFSKMIAAAEENDVDVIEKIKKDLFNKKHVFSFVTTNQVVALDKDNGYVSLDRDVVVFLNEVRVCEYHDVHYGYYGGGGTGWWVEEGDTTLDSNIIDAFEVFGIWPPDAEVPEPGKIDDAD